MYFPATPKYIFQKKKKKKCPGGPTFALTKGQLKKMDSCTPETLAPGPICLGALKKWIGKLDSDPGPN